MIDNYKKYNHINKELIKNIKLLKPNYKWKITIYLKKNMKMILLNIINYWLYMNLINNIYKIITKFIINNN